MVVWSLEGRSGHGLSEFHKIMVREREVDVGRSYDIGMKRQDQGCYQWNEKKCVPVVLG